MTYRTHGHDGRALDEMRIEIHGITSVDTVLVGNDTTDERRKRLDEGQEQNGVADVEHRMSVGDLMADGSRGGLDEAYPQRHERQPYAHAYDVEQHMGGTGLTGGSARTECGQNRGDGRAYVVAENDGNGRFQGKKSLRSEGDGQTDGG